MTARKQHPGAAVLRARLEVALDRGRIGASVVDRLGLLKPDELGRAVHGIEADRNRSDARHHGGRHDGAREAARMAACAVVGIVEDRVVFLERAAAKIVGENLVLLRTHGARLQVLVELGALSPQCLGHGRAVGLVLALDARLLPAHAKERRHERSDGQDEHQKEDEIEKDFVGHVRSFRRRCSSACARSAGRVCPITIYETGGSARRRPFRRIIAGPRREPEADYFLVAAFSSMAFLSSAVASEAALADLARLRTAMSWLWKYAPLAAVQYSQLM